jgi:hypothetical protein
MFDDRIEPYAAAVRKLLKGVVYHDDAVWSQIRDYELPIREYLGKIGLGLHLDEVGSFAYIFDESRDEDNPQALPALTTRRALSFVDTLLLVLLRERLDEHEMRDVDGTRLLLSEDDIVDMMEVFLSDHPDARRVELNITTSINRLKNYGFLTQRPSGHLEVRPLIRAKISADTLEEIRSRLIDYLNQNNDMDLDENAESV